MLLSMALMMRHLFLAAPKEPIYQGQTLSQWIVQLDQAVDRGQGELAVEEAQSAIRAIGTNALPYALANLHARATLGDQAIQWLAKRAPFLKLHPKNVAEQWALGVQILDILGPTAKSCLPELIAEATNNPGYSEEAMLAVGAAAVPAFTNLVLTTRSPETAILIRAFASTISRGQLKSAEAAPGLLILRELSKSKDRGAAQAANEVLNPVVIVIGASP